LTSVTNDITFNTAIEAKETSYFGISDKTYIVGQRDATINLTGLFDQTTAATLETAIDNLVSNAANSAITLEVGPQGNGAGKKKYTMGVIPTSYDIGVPVGDVVKLSINFQRTGGTTTSTY
jgi:hypothetical protein